MAGKLEGKVAIVTGASRGIGVAIAKLFAEEGAKVVCAARTLREGEHRFLPGSLEKTVAEIRAAGGEATPVAANVSEWGDCEKLVKAARETYGPVDVLVNNAALYYESLIVDYPLNRWLRTWGVNLHGPFMLSKLALEDMIPRRSGSIVNVSSGAARGPGRGPYSTPPRPGQSAYGPQKAALERFTQGLAQEVYQYGISVTCFSPSEVVPSPAAELHHFMENMPKERLEPPEIMAKAALLLATEPLDKVTGRVTYSQQILLEFGWITKASGIGVDPDRLGSGYSQI